MKRIISLLLTAVLLTAMLSVFALPASAASDSVENCLRLTSTGSTKIGFYAFPTSPNYKLEYAVNGDPWTQANEDTEINLNDKDFVRFRANGSSETMGLFSRLTFKMSGDGTVAASGNAMSLLKDDKCSAYCFAFLFENCTALTTAPALPATTLAPNCYANMFYGCTALKVAPALPATTLALGCYGSMFMGCTALKAAPAILPATKLAESCYNSMFYNCTALTAAPTLLATEMAQGCYDSMFTDCTSLKITAEQPKTGHYSELRFPNTDCLNYRFRNEGDILYTFYNVPDMPEFKANTTYYSPHSSGVATEYEDEIETTIETVHWEKEICVDCGKVLSSTELGRDVTVTKTTAPYQPNSDPTPTGSILSGGSLTIICTVAAAVIFGLGGFVLGRKKKKPAIAGGKSEK